MSDYRVAVGTGVALASLTKITPQPKSQGIRWTERLFLADGSVYVQGQFVELSWSILGKAGTYQNILTAFGLLAATSANITLYCRDEVFNYHRYNGVAIRPEQSWNNMFVRDTTILVRNLVFLS